MIYMQILNLVLDSQGFLKRILKIRHDKNLEDCIDLKEFTNLYSEKKYNINEKFDFNKDPDKKKENFKFDEENENILNKKEIYHLLEDENDKNLKKREICNLLDDEDEDEKIKIKDNDIVLNGRNSKKKFKFDNDNEKNDLNKNNKKIYLGYNQNFEELSDESQNSFSNIYSNLATLPQEDFSYKLPKTQLFNKEEIKLPKIKMNKISISMSDKKKNNYDDLLTQNIRLKPKLRNLIKIKNIEKKREKKVNKVKKINKEKKKINKNYIINDQSLKELNSINEKSLKINSEDFFKNKEFYIADNFSNKKKNEIKKLIEKHKGNIVSNVLNSTDYIISDKADLRTTTLVQLYEKNALNENFILDCVKNKNIIKKIIKSYLTFKYKNIK